MRTNRRHFIVSMGALIFMTGSTGRSLALSGTIQGVRYGMLHDETRCIGCTACMDACREVNQVLGDWLRHGAANGIKPILQPSHTTPSIIFAHRFRPQFVWRIRPTFLHSICRTDDGGVMSGLK